jgi:hypothetical protein
MSTGTIPACTLGLTVEVLSAWRDESLPRAERARLAAHLASCPACHDRLAQYDAIAAELRAQPVPVPDARLWAAVRAGMAGGARSSRSMARARPSAPRVWKGLAAVAAALLLVAGFGQVLHLLTAGRGTPSAARTPTATTGPISALRWQPATFPAGFDAAQTPSPSAPTGGVIRTIAVSPATGDTAYACAPPQPGQGPHPLVWVTQDRAAHWTRLTDVPSEGPVDTCAIEADAHDTSAAVAILVRRQDAHEEVWATFNGGHTWQRLPTAPHLMDQLTTIGATSYALRMEANRPEAHVMVSADHLQTWTAIDADISAAGARPFGLWVNPATSELLVAALRPPATPGGSALTTLWDSRDGGQHWTLLPLNFTDAVVVVARPTAGKPWVLCVAESAKAATPSPTSRILCSTNGGQTWVSRPPLVPSSPAAGPIRLAAIASDGALLAFMPQWDATHQRISGYDLYRFAPRVGQWQTLGPVPEPQALYAPTATGGLLWSLSSPQTLAVDNPIGNFTSPTGSGIFVAAYP